MSDFLTINGYAVPVSVNASGEVDYQEVGGEVVRAYAGNLLSSVKATARVWKVVTVPMPNQMGLGLASTLELGGTLDCDGVFLGGPVTCRARSVRTMAVATAHGPHRVVEFELHEQEPAKSPWAIVFGYQGGNLISRPAINFTRSSPALYRDRSGVWQEAAPGVPRTTWGTDPVTGLLVPRYLTEPGGTNLIPGNRQRFEGWTQYMGAVATITQGQTIPGWTRPGVATRIQTSGGTSTIKYRYSLGVRGEARPEATSVIVHNIGEHAVVISTNGGGPDVQVAPGAAMHVKTATAAAVASSGAHLTLSVLDPAYDLDIVAWAPQITATEYHLAPILDPTASSPDPTVHDRDTLYLDLPAEVARPGVAIAVYARTVLGAAPVAVAAPGVWGITSGAGSPPQVFLYVTSTGRLRLRHHLGAGTSADADIADVALDAGAVLEALSLIWSDDQGRLVGRLIASVNRGPLAAADLDPLAPAAAWSAPRLYVGSRGTAPGVYEFEALKVYAGRLSGSDAEMMAFMAAFGGV